MYKHIYVYVCLSVYLYVFSTWRPSSRPRRTSAGLTGRYIHIHICINTFLFISAYLSVYLSICNSHLAPQPRSATYECTSHGSIYTYTYMYTHVYVYICLSARPPTRAWEVARTIVAPPSSMVKCLWEVFVWGVVLVVCVCQCRGCCSRCVRVCV